MRKVLLKTLGKILNTLAIVFPKQVGRIGFHMFCRPQSGKLKAHNMPFLNKADDLSFMHEGNLLKVYRWGKGRVKIALLHGWGDNSARWKHLVNYLRHEDCTIIALDAPAHGASGGKTLHIPKYSSAIKALAQRVGGFDVTVTHSFGGACAIYALSLDKNIPLGDLAIIASPGEVKDFFTYYKNMLGLSDLTMQLVHDHFKKEIGHDKEYFSIKSLAHNVQNKSLIIHDVEDRSCPYKYAKMLNQELKNSELMTTTGLGHKMKSPIVYEAIAQFCNFSEVYVD
jgi:pimeloyl-ACP methyl ester carboxylesterase